MKDNDLFCYILFAFSLVVVIAAIVVYPLAAMACFGLYICFRFVNKKECEEFWPFMKAATIEFFCGAAMIPIAIFALSYIAQIPIVIAVFGIVFGFFYFVGTVIKVFGRSKSLTKPEYATLILGIVFILLVPFYAKTHSGRTDNSGGHYDRSTGDYHYHGGSAYVPLAPAPKTVFPTKNSNAETYASSAKNNNAEESISIPGVDELQGILYKGKTYVQLRPICEALDANIQWFPWEKATMITLPNQKTFKVTTKNINP